MIQRKWSIKYYTTPSRDISPVAIFIQNLPERAQARLSHVFDLLKEFGTRVGLPHVKKLAGHPLWEIRILGRNSIRILYVVPKNKTFLLLHGFIKRKQKTPRREIKTALTRLSEYQIR